MIGTSRFASSLRLVSTVLLLFSVVACEHSNPRPPNLILVSIDTLRADRLGTYGYARDTSPHLDAYAERGVVFETVIAESNWTLPSHITMLTGLFPSSHGVTLPYLQPGADTELLAERLQRSGYRTAASTDGGYMNAGHGFARGFDLFDERPGQFREKLERTLEFLENDRGSAPGFAFVHTYDVHCPYDPREPFRGTFDSAGATSIETRDRCGNPDFNELDLTEGQARYLSDRYDDSIREADSDLGWFLGELERCGLLSESIVIVTSDHGEEFLEHGKIGHEGTLHREVLRVPMIVLGADLAHRRIEMPVGLADLVPTVLGLLDLSPPDDLDGRSFAEAMRPSFEVGNGSGWGSGSGSGGTASTEERKAMDSTTAGFPVETLQFSELSWGAKLLSVVSSEHHLIFDLENESISLYDWKEDPAERHNLASERRELVSRLAPSIRSHRRSLRPRAALPIGTSSAAYAERLRSLGYTN